MLKANRQNYVVNKQWKRGIIILISFLILVQGLLLTSLCRAGEPFPLYPIMKPNVEFWKKVYTKYSTEQGIIHDSENLDVIYEVIRLKKREQPGATRTNRYRIKNAKSKYKKILSQLAKNPSIPSPEARRVAALFGPNASRRTYRKSMNDIRCQVGQNNRFREGLIRSGAYLDEIRGILRSYGVPVDLAYLPHVESSFNPKAYSKFGAAGIWQFTRSTGKRFMKVGYTLDERRDPIRATHAAARLLKENYEKLGTWPLAITAYNHGAAGMSRAKKKKGSYPAIFKGYKSRLFRFASRNFYSEFLAARVLAKNHREYFGQLKFDKPPRTFEVKLEGYATIKDLARFYEVSLNTIRDFNLALREPVYRGQKFVPKGYRLRLPQRVGQKPLRLASKPPDSIYKSHQKRSRFYTVRKGDTAGKIAKMHRIKLSDLIMANNLNSRATIYALQNLRIPGPDEDLRRLAMVDSINKKKRKAKPRPPSPEGKGQSVKTTKPEPQKEIPQPKQKEQLAKLELPSINPAVVTSNLHVERLIEKKGKRIGIIRVEAEETLGHYADWLNTPTKSIRQLNGFRFGKPIRTSQQVKIPLVKISKEEFEEKRFEYHKEIEEDFFESYKIESLKMYRIKNGDNIWSLCTEKFEVPFWLIKKYNPDLDFNELHPLQEVNIPVVAPVG